MDHRVKEAMSITITSDSSDSDSEEAEAALFLLPRPGLSRLLHLSSCWHTQRTSANLNIEDVTQNEVFGSVQRIGQFMNNMMIK